MVPACWIMKPTDMKKHLMRKLADGHGFLSVLLNLRRVAYGYQPIFLDYKAEPLPRYGYGKPAHPELAVILARQEARYAELLSHFLKVSENLLRIPLHHQNSSSTPCWINEWMSGLDTFSLYGFIATGNPALLLEVGSGFSTRLARRAIRDHQLRTKVISIDPQPRAEIDGLCDEIIRQPLEKCDLSVIRRLGPGDILFIDGSHRSFMNSDVTIFFLEILPRLHPGVHVHIHDIFLPHDYEPWWLLRFYPHRYWSEQYLLAVSLLAGHSNYEVILPNYYVSITPEISSVLDAFWSNPLLAGVPRGGSSFWIEIR
jgi:hypothetical protein